MPSIASFGLTNQPLPGQRRFVQVRRKCDDPWQFFRYLDPIQSTEGTTPEIGSAQFVYHFGEIKREDSTNFTFFTAPDLRDFFVRILLQDEGSPPYVAWNGVIADENAIFESHVENEGDVVINAYGLGHIIDRIEIDITFVNEGTNENVIQRPMDFNLRSKRGATLLGNRSDNPDSTGFAFRFSKDDSVWTNHNIVEYLLEHFSPLDCLWFLAGQQDELRKIKDVHSLHGKTLWQAMNQLIDRRDGLTFDVRLIGDLIFLWISTVSDVPITFGSKTLAANANPVFFVHPTAPAFDHIPGSLPVRFTTLNKYDEVIVRGNQFKVVATFAYDDKTLVRGWTDSLEDEYKDGAGGDDADLNDVARGNDRLSDVYRTHLVPPDWDHNAGLGFGGPKFNISLRSLADGTVTNNTAFSNIDKRFLKWLPFEEGVDYSKNPPVRFHVAKTEPDLRRPFALIDDLADSPEHDATNQLHFVHRTAQAIPGGGRIPSASVRILDHQFGFHLVMNPNHSYGLDHFMDVGVNFLDGAKVSNHSSVFDYFTLKFIGFFEIDRFVEVRQLISGASDAGKKLTIRVPGAEFWFVASGSIIDLDKDGVQVVYGGPDFLRDDRDLLEAVMAFVLAWYGVERNAVQMPFKKMGLFVPLGAMLLSINTGVISQPVRTVVTRRRINYRAGTTVIETGWNAQDFAPSFQRLAAT